jgi:hypothetical protein
MQVVNDLSEIFSDGLKPLKNIVITLIDAATVESEYTQGHYCDKLQGYDSKEPLDRAAGTGTFCYCLVPSSLSNLDVGKDQSLPLLYDIS